MKPFMKNSLKISGFAICTGIVLTIVGFSMNNPYVSGHNNYDFSENYGDVESLIIDITYGSVMIKEGETFQVEAANMIENDFSSTVVDGIWNIHDNKDTGNGVNLFDINLPINTWKMPEEDLPRIVITLPADFEADNLEITLDAGTIEADQLIGNHADINIGAGSCRIKSLTVHNESNYSVGAGELIIDYINAKDINMENGVGNLSVTGIITGDNYVESGVGNVTLSLIGSEDNYNYKVDCGIGNVIINDNSYNAMNSKNVVNDSALNSFSLESGVGRIELTIKE